MALKTQFDARTYMFYLWMLLATLVILIAQIYFLGRKMSEPEKMIVPLSDGYRQGLELRIAPNKNWLDSFNLLPIWKNFRTGL